jgi:polyhydroxybutyrate depolymerase
VANNADTPEPRVSSLGSDTTVRARRGNSPQSDAIFYRADGAGHTWPGGKQYLPKLIIGTTSDSFNATATIWQFFSSHRSAQATRGRRAAQ